MAFNIFPAKFEEVLSLRTLFLHENNFQIRYNACHERGWADRYMIEHKGAKVGYGAIKGADNLKDRDAVFEFYLLPSFRHLSSSIFNELLHISGANFIECQSNDQFLTSLLYQYSQNIRADVILFGDNTTTFFNKEEVVFRRRHEMDVVFEHKREPVGDFVLEWNNEIVASGGFALHYNVPFADLSMEVKEMYHGKGLGSFLVQELKRECYLSGRVPAARCSMENAASKATLLKAGLKIVGFMLFGNVKRENNR
jgi:GNAT superfamily N-acetyltransferase